MSSPIKYTQIDSGLLRIYVGDKLQIDFDPVQLELGHLKSIVKKGNKLIITFEVSTKPS